MLSLSKSETLKENIYVKMKMKNIPTQIHKKWMKLVFNNSVEQIK